MSRDGEKPYHKVKSEKVIRFGERLRNYLSHSPAWQGQAFPLIRLRRQDIRSIADCIDVDAREVIRLLSSLVNVTKGEPWFPNTDKYKAREEALAFLTSLQDKP